MALGYHDMFDMCALGDDKSKLTKLVVRLREDGCKPLQVSSCIGLGVKPEGARLLHP